MAQKLGVLTIGQAPRPDGLARDIQAVLGTHVQVIERGALDGLTPGEITQLRPEPDDYRLVTLLRDGTSALLAKRAILDRLQAQITDLETNDGVAATLLLCTGAFPPFAHQRPLLQPQAALYGAVIGMANGGRIGALTPLPSQLDQARGKWAEMGIGNVVLAAADPYAADALAAVHQAAAAVRRDGASILFMDCFGYNLEMRRAARDAFGGPVVLARSLAARLVAELLD